jgi:hypothetical protein
VEPKEIFDHEERHYHIIGVDGHSENLCFLRPIIITIVLSPSTESCFVAPIIIIISTISIVIIIIDPK